MTDGARGEKGGLFGGTPTTAGARAETGDIVGGTPTTPTPGLEVGAAPRRDGSMPKL